MNASLTIVCTILLILPFLCAYVHSRINKRILSILLYYRYFMTFNMILAGLFVTGRMFFDGPHAAQIAGWVYSPIYIYYSVAILSMAIMAILTVYSRRIIMLAPAITWSAFLLLSTIVHVYELDHHQNQAVSAINIHVVYNLLVVLIILRMAHRINMMFRRQIAEKQSAQATN